MTVATNNITSGPYTGNGSTSSFSYTFRVEDKTQLKVFETNTNGIVTELTVDTDYTVNNVGTDGGGTIDRIAGALPSGYKWYIRSNYDVLQDTEYSSQGAYNSEIHEASFDKLTFLVQQLYDLVGRTFRLSDSDPDAETVNLELPSVAERASRVLVFDSNGDLDVGALIGSWRGDWATATGYNERDLFIDPATNNVYFVLADHTSTTISADVTAGDIELVIDAEYVKTQADAAAASASAASTSETNAAASASAASTSATNSASAASAASTSETNAAASASAASTSETNAEASETAAAASAAAAATTYDNFDDRYLGAKASDPALDNDGEALLTGALYYNTTVPEMRVYSGSLWQSASNNAVIKTSDTGSAIIPSGTEAQRDGTPQVGYTRFNTDIGLAEIYNGTAWGPVGGGATGSNGDQVFVENDQEVTADYTIPVGKSASSTGPITINTGVTVTVSSGSVWVIL